MAAARGAARRCRPVAEGGCGRRSSLARSTRSRARGDRGGRRGVPDDGGHEAQLGRNLDEPSSRSTQAAQSRIDSCSSLRGLVRLASPDPSRSSGRRRRPTTGDACVRRPLWWPSSGVMASAARGARNQTGRPRHDGMVSDRPEGCIWTPSGGSSAVARLPLAQPKPGKSSAAETARRIGCSAWNPWDATSAPQPPKFRPRGDEGSCAYAVPAAF